MAVLTVIFQLFYANISGIFQFYKEILKKVLSCMQFLTQKVLTHQNKSVTIGSTSRNDTMFRSQITIG